jgi:asparagine synthetase B (glutamine-hydrolysing)
VLLKDAARGWLPDQVIDRPKMGFGVPIASWLRNDLRDPARAEPDRSREEAAHWKDKVEERNRSWEEEDRRWEGE